VKLADPHLRRVDVPPRADRLPDLFSPAIVDIFAGCGGASVGIEQALVEVGLGRGIDLMVNHWDVAVGVHEMNHPLTHHLHADVREVDPRSVLPGRPIGYLHASPDCTHHSKARGSRPKRKELRALAWVVVKWAILRRPTVITLENVEEFRSWGPLGEDGQPCKARKGQSFDAWIRHLGRLGYAVEHRELRACDYGAPTTRKRLFVVARCDGKPIVWPEKTHGTVDRAVTEAAEGMPATAQEGVRSFAASSADVSPARRGERAGTAGVAGRTGSTRVGVPTRRLQPDLKPFRMAAECIDWSIPMLSIFATPDEAKAWAAAVNEGRERHDRVGVPRRPLKEKTLRRIAGGLMKYVVNASRPFIVDIENYGWSGRGHRSVDEPLNTITSGPRGGKHAAIDVAVAPYGVPRYGERDGQDPRCLSFDRPLPTITGTANGASLVAAFVTKHNGGTVIGSSLEEPMHTLVAGLNKGLTCAWLTKHYGNPGYAERPGIPADVPLSTVTAGDHHAVTCAWLSHMDTSNTFAGEGDPRRQAKTITSGGQHAACVAAFVQTYYGNGGVTPPSDPAPTVVGRDRFGLVTVVVDGVTYAGVDIAMRMLTPRELARCQGFEDDYVIDRLPDGTRLSKADQVKLIGNSVPPAFMRALARENVVKPGVLLDRKAVLAA